MSRRVFLVFVLFSAKGWTNTDDWLGVDSYGGHLGLKWGSYQSDGENYSVNLVLPLFFSTEFNALYSGYRSSDRNYGQDSQQLGLFWNTDPYQYFSWGLGYFDEGRSSNFRTKDYSFYLQYLKDYQWQFKLRGIKGSSVIDTVGFSSLIESQFRSLGIHEIDRVGLGLSFGFDGTAYGVRVGATVFDYSDTKEVPRGLVDLLVDDIDTNEARFYYQEAYLAYFQLYRLSGHTVQESHRLTSAVFQTFPQELSDYVDARVDDDPKNTLSNHELSFDYYYSLHSVLLSAGIFVYESYISETHSSQSYVAINYQSSKHYSYGFSLSYSAQNSELYGELSLGFDW